MAIKLPLAQLHLALAVVLAPAAQTTTSALAPETREIRDGADVLASFGTARGLVKKMDIGALKNGQRRATFLDIDKNHECPQDSVFYYGGNVYVGGSKSEDLEDGCNGKCCVGTKACSGLTGCVKTDGSCTGEYACFWAYAGKIINSCQADDACDNLGYNYFRVLGYNYFLGSGVGTIDNSCNAKGACSLVSHYATIKSITGSCNSEKHKSCAPLQGTYGNEKEFGDITQFKRDFRVKKTRTEDIEACMALCAERKADLRDHCSGIKWRQGVQKPCRIFKGGFSEGKCHDKDLCMDL